MVAQEGWRCHGMAACGQHREFGGWWHMGRMEMLWDGGTQTGWRCHGMVAHPGMVARGHDGEFRGWWHTAGWGYYGMATHGQDGRGDARRRRSAARCGAAPSCGVGSVWFSLWAAGSGGGKNSRECRAGKERGRGGGAAVCKLQSAQPACNCVLCVQCASKVHSCVLSVQRKHATMCSGCKESVQLCALHATCN